MNENTESVPVVAIMFGDIEDAGWIDHIEHVSPADAWPGFQRTPLVRQADHLAALASLRAEVEALRRDATLGAAIQRAARDLPDGYEINVCVERGAGWAVLYNEQGDVINVDAVDADDRLVAEIHVAIDAARASQRTWKEVP